MTLVEFLAPLKKSTHGNRVLAVLYYLMRYEGVESATVAQIRSAMRRARAPSWKTVNVANVLARSAPNVESPGQSGSALLWRLTGTGQAHIRTLLDLPEAEPEVEHDVRTLESIAAKIGDADVRNYVEEAVKCLRFGALRASVVFLWAGAIRVVQQDLLAKYKKGVAAAVHKFDARVPKVTRLDHFAYVKDATTLLAAQHLGLIDKNEKAVLEGSLRLRNSCGHPGKYKPGVKKVSSFIEDVVGIVFQ